MRFGTKVAIITGGAGGIGSATAHRLASEGAVVVINDVNDERIDATVRALEGLPGRGVPGRADITSEEQVTALIERVIRDEGGVDILVNNAGGMMPGAAWSTVEQSTLADWNSFLALNLTGAFLMSRAVIPSMLERGRGHIVSVSSISGTNGQVAGSGYAAAKAGLTGLTASLAKEVGRTRHQRQRNRRGQRAVPRSRSGAPGPPRLVGAPRSRRRASGVRRGDRVLVLRGQRPTSPAR